MRKRNTFLNIANKIDDKLDALRGKLFKNVNSDKPIMIQPYRGFGNDNLIHLWGRVLVNKQLKEATAQDTVWDNVLAMVKRFNSNEIAYASVVASFQNQTQTAQADKEGYFQFTFPIENPLPANENWHTVDMSYTNDQGTSVETTAKFLVPPATAHWGIISDIDDTVLRTNSSNLLRMARLTFFNNAHTRLPFKGVAAFYRALHRGTSQSSHNPLFYVSSSPWNLYDLLEDFFELHQIPMGPFFLRDFGIDETKFIKSGHGDHKLAQIEKIMTTYPDMEFILIGDSGEKDPEIFSQVVHDFKGRVKCIYIRDVTQTKRDEAIQKLATEVASAGIEMILIEDSEAAAKHAAEKGFIDPATLSLIAKGKRQDENAPDELEQVMKGIGSNE